MLPISRSIQPTLPLFSTRHPISATITPPPPHPHYYHHHPAAAINTNTTPPKSYHHHHHTETTTIVTPAVPLYSRDATTTTATPGVFGTAGNTRVCLVLGLSRVGCVCFMGYNTKGCVGLAAGQLSVSGRGLQQKGFGIWVGLAAGTAAGTAGMAGDNHPHRSVSGIGCGTAGEGTAGMLSGSFGFVTREKGCV
ncbi:hypothetical protein Tco_0328023 [Tanacetum coccineum]